MTHQHRSHHEPIETDKCWADFWEPIVAPQGVIDLDLVKAELHDYHAMMQQVPLVYDHVTGGRVSKPLTMAGDVIAEADAHWDEERSSWCANCEAMQDQIDSMTEDMQEMRSELRHRV